MTPLSIALAACVPVGSMALTPDWPRNHLLSAPIGLSEDILMYQVGSDGLWAAYVKSGPLGTDLYSARLDRSQPPIPLDLSTTTEVTRLRISPDGTRVVYDAFGSLHSVPIDGSAAPIQLSGPNVGRVVTDFQFTADGGEVVYVYTENGHPVRTSLHRAPLDGSAPPVLLDSQLGLSGGFGGIDDDLRVGASHVAYRRIGLGTFSVKLDGSGTPVHLSSSQTVELHPGGEDIVYLRGANVVRQPLDGSVPPLQINSPLPPGRACAWFTLDPTEARVVYLADGDTANQLELFSARFQGGPASKLNGVLAAGEQVSGYKIDPRGRRVLFHTTLGGLQRLWSAPIAGGTPALDLLGLATGVFGYQFSPDGTRLAAALDLDGDEIWDLHALPTRGGTPPVLLSDPVLSPGSLHDDFFAFTADGEHVLFTPDSDPDGIVGEPDEHAELFAADAMGGTPPIRISGPLALGRSLRLPAVPSQHELLFFDLAGGRVTYLADQDRDEVVELYVSTLPPAQHAGHVR